MNDAAGLSGLHVAAFESRMAREMTGLIGRYGGTPLVAPALREVPLENNTEALRFGEQLLAGAYDMMILLTGVGTRVLVGVLRSRYPLEEIKAALARVSLVARGPKPVAALKDLALTPAVTVPEPNTWRDVLHSLDAGRPLAGLRIAVQEYGATSAELLTGLRERGAAVTSVPVYRWELPEDLAPLRVTLAAIIEGRVEVLLITNAVQVDHVMQLLAEDRTVERFRAALNRMVVASIGPTTSSRLKSHGLPVDLEPSHPKMGILVKETASQAQALLSRKRSP